MKPGREKRPSESVFIGEGHSPHTITETERVGLPGEGAERCGDITPQTGCEEQNGRGYATGAQTGGGGDQWGRASQGSKGMEREGVFFEERRIR